jgi:Flp pilus assembly protein TadG
MFATLRRAARSSERGSAAVQSAILFPIVLLLVFGIIQGALWFHARHIALGAAQEGARVASAENGVGGDQRAREFVRDLTGGTLLRDLAVAESFSADTVTIVVSGLAPSLIPGVSGLSVEQHATMPLETFIEVSP